MANSSTPARISALADISNHYDAILCDIWGVLHNGVRAFPQAHPALVAFRSSIGAPVVLVTNAPRPNGPIHGQLHELGITPDSYDAIVTSGDVTLNAVRATPGDKVFHVGPERDINIFDDLPVTLTNPEAADMIVCTGLFDDETETPDDYREQFEPLVRAGLPMICANPDLVVHRGDHEIYCAGALARLYEELGGAISVNGKPHPPIYDESFRQIEALAGRSVDRSKILAIGDAFRTDVKGAVDAGLDCLLITSGIHHTAFGPINDPQPDMVHEGLRRADLSAVAFMPWLA